MKRRPKNTCSEFYKLICEDLEKKLSSPQCRALRKHLQECDQCASCLDGVRKTIDLFRDYPAPPLPRRTRQKLFKVLNLG